MTKQNNLQKLLIQTPNDIRNLIFSFVSLEGQKYDKIWEKAKKKCDKFYQIERTRDRYLGKIITKRREIKRLYIKKYNMISKIDKEIEECKRIKDNYNNRREALEYPQEIAEDEWHEMLYERQKYEKLEQKFKKYKKFREPNKNQFTNIHYSIDTDSEPDEDTEDEDTYEAL
tara:strand:- start:28 stop:543 length:516 start_codon:yes stop_codon:yes gene_type:complete